MGAAAPLMRWRCSKTTIGSLRFSVWVATSGAAAPPVTRAVDKVSATSLQSSPVRWVTAARRTSSTLGGPAPSVSSLAS